MSRSLVRKTLDLFEKGDDISDSSSAKKSTNTKVMLIANKSRATSKKRKRNESSCLKSSVEQLRMKCVLDDVKKRKNLDLTEDNLFLIHQFSQTTAVEPVAVDKIISHQTGRLAKNQPPAKKKRKEEKTLFSDEDFEKFEKEYFVGT